MSDLHSHSTASDGTDSPAQLVENARQAGVTILGITDHDTTSGWDLAARQAQFSGIGLVRGAEVSASYLHRSVHILSYLHDPNLPGLNDLLERTRQARLDRLIAMTELLAQDYPISWPAVMAQTADNATVGRPHIADALVAAGVVPNRDVAFSDLISPQGSYYVRYQAAPANEVIQAIKASGGVAVIAHPFAPTRGRGLPDEAIQDLVNAGLDGLEVWHREMDEPARQRALRLADQFGLLTTGSSDYHGVGKANRLGEHWTTPETLAEIALRGALPILEPTGQRDNSQFRADHATFWTETASKTHLEDI